jgi:hypothetical protein
MSYIINKTDGSELTTIIDGTVDQIATDLTLIGKNSSSYGEAFNENFVRLLENFASGTAPTNRITGQLWFDTTENRLKVYDGNLFKVSGGTIVSAAAPSDPVAGDLWLDSARQQLYFYDGTAWFLTGPSYSSAQGVSGFNVTTILDTLNKSHTVVFLYVDNIIIGVFAKAFFTPLQPIPNFIGDIYPGFNLGTYTDVLADESLQFRTEVETATNLKSSEGDLFTTIDFVHASGDSIIDAGTLTIQSDRPLILGPGQNNEIRVDENSFDIVGNNSGQNVTIKAKPSSGNPLGLTLYNPGTFELITTAATGNGSTATITFAEQIIPPFAVGASIEVKLVIPAGYQGTYVVTGCTTTTVSFANTTTQNQTVAGTVGLQILPRLGILTDNPSATLDVNGAAVIRGDLTVLGDVTTVYTSVLKINDKNIELATPEDNTSPTNALADGGGITLHGTTDKTISWRNDADPANQFWTSSEHFNLELGKTFKIDGVDVLSATSLGSNITSAPGISTLGTLTSLNVGTLGIATNTISATASDLVLNPSGVVNVSSKRITNVAAAGAGTDAVNRDFLYGYVRARSLGLSVNINNASGGTLTNTQIIGLVQEVYPASEYDNNTICRVHCTFTTVTFSSIPVTISDTSPTANISKSFVTVNKGAGTENSSVVQDITWQNNIDAGAASVTTTRTIKIYTVTSGTWAFTSSSASTVIV